MRNEENYNLTISIKRGSPLHKALLADGEDLGSKQLGVIACARLAEYYEWKEQGLISVIATLLSGGKVEIKPSAELPSTGVKVEPNGTRLSLDEMLQNAQELDAFL